MAPSIRLNTPSIARAICLYGAYIYDLYAIYVIYIQESVKKIKLDPISFLPIFKYQLRINGGFMNIIKRVVRKSHIKINDQDYMTYEYARSKGLAVSNKESWEIEGVRYYMMEKDLVVDDEVPLGVGA